MGKSTDTYIWEVEILAATKFNILSQNYAANIESNIELLMPVLDYLVNSTLKNTQGISVECMKCLNEDVKRRKKDKSCTLWVGTIESLPVPNYLILRMNLIDSVLI